MMDNIFAVKRMACLWNLEKGMATHSSILAWRTRGQRSLVGHSPWGCKSRTWLKQLNTVNTHVYGRRLKKLVTRIVFGEDKWESRGEKWGGEWFFLLCVLTHLLNCVLGICRTYSQARFKKFNKVGGSGMITPSCIRRNCLKEGKVKVKVVESCFFATPWTIQSIEFSRPEYWSG